MRPLATILGSVGIETVPTGPIVRVTLLIPMSCMGISTGVPRTPTSAMVPPGRTSDAAVSSVSG
jgi:hypothetical protein